MLELGIKGIPDHKCTVLDIYYVENRECFIRCRVCDRTVLWADIQAFGGQIGISFLSQMMADNNKEAMYYSKAEQQKLR